MTTVEIRLECLVLAHRHDKEVKDIVERAKKFEEYLTEGTEEDDKKESSKKVGNSKRAN
jgi:hypothetical protein